MHSAQYANGMLSALERIHRRGWVSVLHGCCIGLVFDQA